MQVEDPAQAAVADEAIFYGNWKWREKVGEERWLVDIDMGIVSLAFFSHIFASNELNCALFALKRNIFALSNHVAIKPWNNCRSCTSHSHNNEIIIFEQFFFASSAIVFLVPIQKKTVEVICDKIVCFER